VVSTSTHVPAELERKMDEAIARYPQDRPRSAAMPLLHLWQKHFGLISDEGINWIAAKLGLQPINILELVTFYPMLSDTELRHGGKLSRYGELMHRHRHLSTSQ